MNIPALPATNLTDVFTEAKGSPFGAVDSNLAAWLPSKCPASGSTEVDSFTLSEHQDNQEIIGTLGGLEAVVQEKTILPQQIRHLTEAGAMQKNGLSNLFFVSLMPPDLYIIGVVWDATIDKFVPYIYRTRNRYRAWTTGNQVFVRS